MNDRVTIGVSVLRGRARIGKGHRWTTRFEDPCPDYTVVGCIDPVQDRVCDFYVIPAHALQRQVHTSVGIPERSPLSPYRHSTLFGIERLIEGELPLEEDELLAET